MTMSRKIACASIALSLFASSLFNCVLAAPADNVSGAEETGSKLPKINDYAFVQDGEPYQKLRMPVCERIPKGVQPDGMVLAIHGLTLHGKRYELLGKACASTGVYFVAPDMRGFGMCRADTNDKYGRRKINYDRSYDDLSGLVSCHRNR